MIRIIKSKIRDVAGESNLEFLAFMFKVLVTTLLVFQLSIFLIDTSKYYIAINETIRRAQTEGVIRRDYFESQLSRLNIASSKVQATATPNFDTHVNKLGDQLTLRIQYDFIMSFSDLWRIEVPITLKASKTNQGYFGGGYGGGW